MPTSSPPANPEPATPFIDAFWHWLPWVCIFLFFWVLFYRLESRRRQKLTDREAPSETPKKPAALEEPSTSREE